MSETEKKSWSWPEIIVTMIVVVLVLMLLASLSTPGPLGESGPISKSIANCRQIIIALRLYASEHDGAYPDSIVPLAADSNTVFRQLFVSGALEDEKFFGAGASRYQPDGDLGDAPHYARALEPGENHWAMTKGLKDSASGGMPLVYENPIEASWPPYWSPDMAGRAVKGRSWKGGMIIVGANDGSVGLMRLESLKGLRVTLKAMGTGEDGSKNAFTRYQKDDGKPYEVLDAAVPPAQEK